MQKNEMRPGTKHALTMVCFTAGLGAFGLFFRWLQNQTAFNADTGLNEPGMTNVLVVLVVLVAAAVLLLKLRRIGKEGYALPDSVYDAFRGRTVVYPAIIWCIGILMAIGGAVTLSNVRFDEQKTVMSTVAILGILSGLSFPMICTAARRRYSPGLVSLLMTLPIVMFCIWLVASYKQHATNPVVWAYSIEILAICAAIIAFFFTAGYPYGRAKPQKAVFWAAIGAFFCFMTLADARYAGELIMFLGSGAMLLMEIWMIVSNLKPAEEAEAKSEEAPAAQEPEDEVIAPAAPDAPAEEPSPEPTLKAPEKK